MSQGWLFTVEEWQKPVRVGTAPELWTDAPLDQTTGTFRKRKSDGGPYTPAWGPDDHIVTFYPESGRCFGLLDIVSEPDWQPSAEQFFLTTRVRAWNKDMGPTLADIGVLKALQGGRHRLTDEQLKRAQRAFKV